MKSILILGAGFLQSFVIKKAKELGYYTIAIDKNPNSIGFKYADEYEVIDIVDQKACLQFARSKNINGVISPANDYGVLSAAYVAQKMNLPGLDYDVAKVIKNKYLVRRNLYKNKIDDITQYFEIESLGSLNEIKNEIKYPLIVKPCDGSGSKGISKVDTFEELVVACNEALSSSLIGKALVEDFVEGKELGVESFVVDGEVFVLGIMGKHMTNPPDYAELGHYIPSGILVEDKVKQVAVNTIKSLGVNFGPVNMDVLVKDNDVCVIDIGARMGGNLIGSHIIPLSTDLDYMKVIIQAAVDDSFKIVEPTVKSSVVTKLLALDPGIVKCLPDFKEIEKQNQVEIFQSMQVGSEIREYHNNLDGCGYIVSVSLDLEMAIKKANKSLDMVNKGIIRKVNNYNFPRWRKICMKST